MKITLAILILLSGIFNLEAQITDTLYCSTSGNSWALVSTDNADTRIGISDNVFFAYSLQHKDTFDLNMYEVVGTMTSIHKEDGALLTDLRGKNFLYYIANAICTKSDMVYFDNLVFYDYNDSPVKIADFHLKEIK